MCVFFIVTIFANINSKQQQRVSLIGTPNQKPQIVKANPNGITSPVQAESQFNKNERGKAFRQIFAAFIANIGEIKI